MIIKEIWEAQHWATIIGFVLLVLGSLFTFYGNYRSGEEEKAALKKVITGKDETIDQIKDQVLQQAVGMDNLRNQNTELNGLLLTATKELSNALTGSESYCTIKMNNQIANNPDLFWINVFNNTRYPLKDVTVRVYDNNNPYLPTLENFTLNTKVIGVVKGKSVIPKLFEVTLNRQTGFSVNFFFNSNGPESLHCIRMQYVGGRWISAEQIRVNYEVIETNIDPDFPQQNPAVLFQ